MSAAEALLRWTGTLIQPLVHPDVRHSIDAAVHQLDADNAPLVRQWVAGLACDIAATLPAEDPWRAGSSIEADDLSPRVQDEDEDDPSTLPWAKKPTTAERHALGACACLHRSDAAAAIGTLPDTESRLSVVRFLLARRQAYTGIGDTWVMLAAAERLASPEELDPSWLDPVGDGAYTRITEPLDAESKLSWLLKSDPPS